VTNRSTTAHERSEGQGAKRETTKKRGKEQEQRRGRPFSVTSSENCTCQLELQLAPMN